MSFASKLQVHRAAKPSVEQMPKTEDRAFPNHLRSRIAHHHSDLFAAIALITVHRTFGAGGLFFPKATAIQPEIHVTHQFVTVPAQIAGVFITAVNVQHGRDRFPFSGQSSISKLSNCGWHDGRCGCVHGFASLAFSIAWISSAPACAAMASLSPVGGQLPLRKPSLCNSKW